MAPALEFQGITKEYRPWLGTPVRAVQDLSLFVHSGEIFGFLGPNGAGKTTAIHLAMGFMRPSSGWGRMLGEPFGDAKTRRRVGFLAETVAFSNRPADAAIRFYAGLNGLQGRVLAHAAREALAAVNLQSEAARNVGRFSRGMLQRFALAQALVNGPELLILDEPTSALDPASRVAVRELLLRLRDQGKTIFLSSHLLSEVELVCDRVAVLHQGRLVRVGRLADLLEVADQTEIVADSVPPGIFPGATVEGSRVRFTVPGSCQREAIERVWSAGGQIVSVNPLRRSLEDVFLELTAPDSGGESGGK